MEHAKALRLMDATADGSLAPDELAALESHLAECAECRAYASQLPAFDHAVQSALQSRYPLQPADARAISTVLGRIQTRNRRHSMTRSTFRTLAWIAMAALLIVAVSWSIRTLLPQPAIPGVQTSAPQETAMPATVVPTQVETAANTPVPTPASSSSAIFPHVQFELVAELPAAPEQVTVYRQELPAPVSLEAMRATAARLGLEAPIYQRSGESPQPVYVVSDGSGMVTFAYGSAEVFNYVADYGSVLIEHGPELPFEQIYPTALAFLDEAGLPVENLLAERLPNKVNGVRFTRTLEGRPVIFGVGKGPGSDLEVILDAEGMVSQLSYFPLRAEPAGQLPILSAEQTWEDFLTGAASDRLRYGVSDAGQPGSLQTWQRSYPSGELVHLYGYAEVLQPAEAGGPALGMFNNWPVYGQNAAAFASQVSPYEFWHAWGQFQSDEQGRQAFHIDGWEVSPLEEKYYQGSIRREGGRALLTTDEGEFELPELPAEAPEGVFTEARGVLSAEGALEWWIVQTGTYASTGYSLTDSCGGGGGGGGGNDFGGGAFRQVSLQPVEPQADPTYVPQSAPFQSGDAVDGATGTVHVRKTIALNGEISFDFYFTGDAIESFSDVWAAHLSGENTGPLERLNNLPVRIWGSVTGGHDDGWPDIELERFEELYPGLRFQAWLGTRQPVTLEGKDVLLFTTLEGEDFILGSSIDFGTSEAAGLQDDRLVIEGLAIPGQTFGGYPVITEFASAVANGDTIDLSRYEITSNRPSIYDESFSESTQAERLEGKAKVEKVELVYATASLGNCRGMGLSETDPLLAPWLNVQPVWRFSGSFEDGRTFEIQIQALAEEHLR